MHLLLRVTNMPKAYDNMFMAVVLKDGAKLATLAERVPTMRPHRDQVLNNERIRIHAAIVSIVDFVMKHPQHARDIWGSIESNTLFVVEEKTDKDEKSEALAPACSLNSWDSSVKTFGQIESNLKWGVMVQVNEDLTRELAQHIDAKDPNACGDIFESQFQVCKDQEIPAELQDVSRMIVFLTLRRRQFEGTRDGWFAAAVSEDGTVNWETKPLFDLKWAKGKVLDTIRHINGDIVAMKKGMNITTEFELENPFSDEKACLVLEPRRHFLTELFKPKEGPNKNRWDKKGKVIGALIEETLNHMKRKREEYTETFAVVDLGIKDLRQRQREAALEKARSCRGIRPAKAPRRLSLTNIPAAIEDADA